MPLDSMNCSVHSITSFRFRFVVPSFRRVTTTCASLSARLYQHGVHICNRQLYTNTHALQLLCVSGIVGRFVTSYFLGKLSSRSIAKEPLIAHCLNFSFGQWENRQSCLGQSAWYTPSIRWTRLRLKNATLSRSKFRLTQQQIISIGANSGQQIISIAANRLSVASRSSASACDATTRN